MRYPVQLDPDPSGSFNVTFPDVPEAITFGENRDHALAMAADALETALDFYFEDRRPVPAPSAAEGRPTVALAASVAAKALLFNEMLSQGVKPVELARRLNVPRQEITRLLNPRHATKIDAIDAALGALGKNLDLRLTPEVPEVTRSHPVVVSVTGQDFGEETMIVGKIGTADDEAVVGKVSRVVEEVPIGRRSSERIRQGHEMGDGDAPSYEKVRERIRQ